jgi:hypothetical protein
MDRMDRVELTRRPAALAPGLDECAVFRKPDDPVVAVFTVSVGDEDVTFRRDRDVTWCSEVIGSAALFAECAQRHQHLAGRTELDHDLAALVPLRRPVHRHRVGHPDVALAIDIDAVRPDEHAAAKAGHDLAVRAELHNRVGLRVAALVAEAGRILEAVAANHRPDMAAVAIDRHFPHRPHRATVRELRPPFSDAIWIRQPLAKDDDSKAWQGDERQRDDAREATEWHGRTFLWTDLWTETARIICCPAAEGAG